jgi:hypothetical protein
VLADSLLNVGGGWVDRDGYSASERIRLLSIVNGASGEAEIFGFGQI